MKKFKIDEMLEARVYDILQDKKYYNNEELINQLSKGFTQKKLQRSIPNQLFSEMLTLDQLTFVQFIWFLKLISDFGMKRNDEKLIKLNPTDWYADLALKEVWEYTPENDIIDKVVFHNVDKIDDNGFQYICSFCSVYDLAKFKENNLINYEFDTQREAKIRAVGTEGAYVKEININQNSIDAISNLIYNNKFTANMITLNVPLLDGNQEKISYDQNTRTLTITPEYNANTHELTFLNCIDGYHRIMSCVDAVSKANKNGKKLRNGFVVSINLMSPESAREHFKRENTYNPVNENYLKTFTNSSEAKFVEAMIEFNEIENIFNHNVVRTFEECKIGNKLTYNKVLEDALKQTNIDTENSKSIIFTMPEVVEFSNELVTVLKAESGLTIEQLKETELLSVNSWIGYLKIFDKSSNKRDMYKNIKLICEKLMDRKVRDDLKELGLNNKNYSAKAIAEYFNNLI